MIMIFSESDSSEFHLCFLLFLSCVVVSSSMFLPLVVGVNWKISSGMSVTSRNVVSIFYLTAVCNVVLRLVNLIQSI